MCCLSSQSKYKLFLSPRIVSAPFFFFSLSRTLLLFIPSVVSFNDTYKEQFLVIRTLQHLATAEA